MTVRKVRYSCTRGKTRRVCPHPARHLCYGKAEIINVGASVAPDK